jgi:enamine deaminase RidA (YjgF/YER057c/UK114 family)
VASPQYLQPASLPANETFSQVVVATGSRLIFTSGQVAVDADNNLVGGDDLSAQTSQAMKNLVAALAAAGATFDDVVKTTTFVAGYHPDQRKLITDAKTPFYKGNKPPASALIGVAALADPAWLIEIEAIAVLGD